VTGRPSYIVGGQLVLDRDGARMVAAALRLAAKAAGRNGADYRGRAQWDDFEWLLAQADIVAAGSAGGTGGEPFTVELPSSGPVPELLTTAQAAQLMGVTARAVTARIERGDLPARRVGREWAITEYDVRRHAARDGRRADDGRRGVPGHLAGLGERPGADEADPGRDGRDRERRRGQRPDTALAPGPLPGPAPGGRPGRRPGGDDAAAADPGAA
jgi:excisionase family DNA binding protein